MVVALLFRDKVSKLLGFVMGSMHAFADEYNSVYKEDENDDDKEEEEEEDSKHAKNTKGNGSKKKDT